MNAAPELLQRIAVGEQSALSELCEQTRPALHSYIRKFVKDPWHAEEVMQDVYLYVWLTPSAFSPERASVMAWLYMLARSRAIDCLRRERNSRAACEFNDRAMPKRRHGPAVTESGEVWRNSRIVRCLKELPATQVRLVSMAFYEGYSHSEIAERTGVPLGTVKTRIRVALRRMEVALRAA